MERSTREPGPMDEIIPLRAQVERRSKALSKGIEAGEHTVAHPAFFIALVLVHAAWMIVNAPWFPWMEAFDPYPYTFLATLASIEAPVITLLVLMRQHRERNIQELRDEVDLLIATRVEGQTTELLRMLESVQRRLDVRESDEARVRREELREALDPEEVVDCVKAKLAAHEE